MVDKFDVTIEHPEKEWWRERRIAPATYFGFPEVAKNGLRGGSLYVEQMDAVTLAVLADRCLKTQVWDPEVWTKFSWRAQQIASRTHEPDLCYIFRAFARADWFDQNLLTTYLGRLQRRLHMFQLPDTAVLLEAFANPKFRQSDYLQRALTHLSLLLQHRDDAKAEELARTCAALKVLRPVPADLAKEILGALQLLAEALLLRELSELATGRMIQTLDCYATWGLASRELVVHTSAAMDLCLALTEQLRGRLQKHGQDKPDDLGTVALAMAVGGVVHEELWEELLPCLEEVTHTMSGPAVAAAAYGVARGGQAHPKLFRAFLRRLNETSGQLSPLDCARAAGGFIRGVPFLAEQAVLRGSIGERILSIGLDSFNPEAMTLLLDSLSRAPAGVQGAEQLAGALLEVLCTRLENFSAPQLASISRSLGILQPASLSVLRTVLDRAQEAVLAAASAGHEEADALGPRYVAMLCQGLAAQSRADFDAPQRLRALLPTITAAAKARPTSLTAAEMLRSLVHCPGVAEREEAVEACLGVLTTARDLPATALVSLTETVAALAAGQRGGGGGRGSGWEPPEELLQQVLRELDMKRYDLPNHVLWRASLALESLGVEPGTLRLESRDQPVK